jgi:hypothetical protein
MFVPPGEVEAHLACGWQLSADVAHDGAVFLVPLGAPVTADAAGAPVVHHCAEGGAGERGGQWAVVCVRRWLRPDGDVAMVSRAIVGWFHTQADAIAQCLRLDGTTGGAS